jgi:RNA polymerase sigma-70 factor (ECF subfamily)
MPHSDTAIAPLVVKAQAGDQECLDELADRFYPEIYRMIYCRAVSRMDAEDIAQEAMIGMVSSIKKLKDPEKFKPWLYRIGLNRLRDFKRKAKLQSLFKRSDPETEKNMAAEADSALDQMLAREFWQHFETFGSRLSRMEREIFTLRYVDQLKINEIAVILHKNESTVKTHLYRALNKFKQASGLRSLLKGVAA